MLSWWTSIPPIVLLFSDMGLIHHHLGPMHARSPQNGFITYHRAEANIQK